MDERDELAERALSISSHQLVVPVHVLLVLVSCLSQRVAKRMSDQLAGVDKATSNSDDVR